MGRRLDNAKALIIEAIRDGDVTEAADKYIGTPYVQHSTGVKDGKEGFVEFFDDFVRRNPVREIEVGRGFEDGRYVFVQTHQNLNNGEFRYVTADILDTDDDAKMIEHWDIIGEIVEETISGHSQVDGPTEPTDLDKTEENKVLVRGFLDTVLKGGDYDKLTDYICAETYIQHNPQAGDGLAGLMAFSAQLAEQGKTMAYEEIHTVIGCGSFVASLSKMDLGGVDMAVIDLFRVDNGKIVEHWDVIEEITPVETWVNTGKF